MEECTKHEMVGCAVCSGEDTIRPAQHYDGGVQRAWTPEEKRIASDLSLSTAEVADLLGRTVNQVSAQRICILGLTGWKGYTPAHTKLPT